MFMKRALPILLPIVDTRVGLWPRVLEAGEVIVIGMAHADRTKDRPQVAKMHHILIASMLMRGVPHQSPIASTLVRGAAVVAVAWGPLPLATAVM